MAWSGGPKGNSRAASPYSNNQEMAEKNLGEFAIKWDASHPKGP
jgi:hypothetical protein